MRPLPELTAENTAFWAGGADGKLKIAFCKDCAAAIHPPQLVCPKCWCEEIENKSVPGTGSVYSYTVNHQPWAPDMKVPFAIAVVDVDGAPGVRVTAEVINADLDSITIGQQMRVCFMNVDDVWFPQWEPVR